MNMTIQEIELNKYVIPDISNIIKGYSRLTIDDELIKKFINKMKVFIKQTYNIRSVKNIIVSSEMLDGLDMVLQITMVYIQNGVGDFNDFHIDVETGDIIDLDRNCMILSNVYDKRLKSRIVFYGE